MAIVWRRWNGDTPAARAYARGWSASKHAARPRTSRVATKHARRDRPRRGGLADAGSNSDNAEMQIVLNGEPREVVAALSILQLLQAEGLAERRVAVEVNGEIVPRSRHADQPLADGDRVEIVHALGGG